MMRQAVLLLVLVVIYPFVAVQKWVILPKTYPYRFWVNFVFPT